jgi:hypothetical protein
MSVGGTRLNDQHEGNEQDLDSEFSPHTTAPLILNHYDV